MRRAPTRPRPSAAGAPRGPARGAAGGGSSRALGVFHIWSHTRVVAAGYAARRAAARAHETLRPSRTASRSRWRRSARPRALESTRGPGWAWLRRRRGRCVAAARGRGGGRRGQGGRDGEPSPRVGGASSYVGSGPAGGGAGRARGATCGRGRGRRGRRRPRRAERMRPGREPARDALDRGPHRRRSALLLAAGFVAVAARAFQLQVLRRDELAERDGRPVPAPARAEAAARARHRSRAASLARGQRRRAVHLRRPRAARREDARGERSAAWRARSGWSPRACAEEAREGARVRLARAARRRRGGRRGAKALRTRVARRRPGPGDPPLLPEARARPRQLLGLVGDDGDGLEGIELASTTCCAGSRAQVPSLRDGARPRRAGEAPAPGREREGARVELTIDQGLQLAAERALARGRGRLARRGRDGGRARPAHGRGARDRRAARLQPERARSRATSCATGRSPTPSSPARPSRPSPSRARSTRGALHAARRHRLRQGASRIGGHVIHDSQGLGWAGPSAHPRRRAPTSARRKIGARLGRERLQRGARSRSASASGPGSGSPGEVRGQRAASPRPRSRSRRRASGRALTATPLQITNAMAAIANGGDARAPAPREARGGPGRPARSSRSDPSPRCCAARSRRDRRRPITRWLEGVVEDPTGTGKRARLDGWRVAGKTGTAQKVDPCRGGYSADRHFSSFVGFAPAEAPRIVGRRLHRRAEGRRLRRRGGGARLPRGGRVRDEADGRAARGGRAASRRRAAAAPRTAPPADEEPATAAGRLADRRHRVAAAGRRRGRPRARPGCPRAAALRRLEQLDLGADADAARAGSCADARGRARWSSGARGCG